ncbi:MAG: hypothetical protein LBM23_03840 [Propionibacteriaceae bacterium]|jgi:hypothetical protein|nr:hypothetical protein [Propionibacteriaceae bacterium]
MDSYVLKPKAPGGITLFVILLVAGLTLTGLAIGGFGGTAMLVTGIVIAVLSLLLVIAIVVGLRRRRVFITLDDDGYTIEKRGREFQGDWSDVERMNVSLKTAKIALFHPGNRRTVIAHPSRMADNSFAEVRGAIFDHYTAAQQERQRFHEDSVTDNRKH